MRKFNDVLSLFDGVSCGRMALDAEGVKYNNYYASEVDKKPIIGARSLYDDTIHLGDVCNVKVKNLNANIGLIIGGSPCQTFSRAGDGSGFNGKSGLFYEFLRVLKEARDINPNVKFMLENVRMKKEWQDIITMELGVEPVHINSELVSAQKRPRSYWTNISDLQQPEELKITTLDILDDEDTFVDASEILYRECNEWRVKNATKLGYLVPENFDVINLDFPKSKTRRGRVAKQKANTLNTGCNQGVFIAGKVKKLSVRECGRLQTIPEQQLDVLLSSEMTDNDLKKAFGNGWTVNVIRHIFKGLK